MRELLIDLPEISLDLDGLPDVQLPDISLDLDGLPDVSALDWPDDERGNYERTAERSDRKSENHKGCKAAVVYHRIVQ